MRCITRLHLILILLVLGAIGLFVAIYRERQIVKKVEKITPPPLPPTISKVIPAKPVAAVTISQEELSKKVIAVAGEYLKIAKEEGKAFERGREILREAKMQFAKGNYKHAIEIAKKSIREFKQAKIFGVKYKVCKTDCLWKIAKMRKHYGCGSKWGKIWWANKKIIKHYRLIYPAQQLFIPGVKGP